MSINIIYSLEEEKRQKEECTLTKFLNYLEDVEKGKLHIVETHSRTTLTQQTYLWGGHSGLPVYAAACTIHITSICTFFRLGL